MSGAFTTGQAAGPRSPELYPGEDPIMDLPGGGVDIKQDQYYVEYTSQDVFHKSGRFVGGFQYLVQRHRSGSLGPVGGSNSGLSSGGSAGGAPSGGTTQSATSAMPTPTGGGRGISIGSGITQEVHAARRDEFTGLDTESPDSMLGPFATPYSVNFNDIDNLGSLSVRHGMVKCKYNRDTVTYSASGIAATYQGSSLCPIPTNDPGSTSPGMLLVFSDGSGVIGATATQRAMVVRNVPLWAKHRDLSDVNRWGTCTLAQGVGVTLSFTLAWATTNVLDDVIAISARYSIVGYPLDVDGVDDRSSSAFTSAVRTSWDGQSVAKVTGTIAAGTYYCTAWAIGRFGISAPMRRKVTIS